MGSILKCAAKDGRFLILAIESDGGNTSIMDDGKTTCQREGALFGDDRTLS
jgi:hypothetical protein